MNSFENDIIKNLYISQYVAAWVVSGGTIDGKDLKGGKHEFMKWLRTLVIDGCKLNEAEVRRIASFATNGKLELDFSAKQYLKGPLFGDEDIKVE